MPRERVTAYMVQNQRPRIRPPRRFWDRVLETIAIIATILGILLVFQAWPGLPDTIPIHFDAAGTADGFGPAGWIWLFPAIGIVMIPLMLFLRLFPWLTNLPIKITEENAEYQYTLVVRLMSLLSCVSSLLLLTLIYDTISIAGGGTSLLGSWFVPLFAGGIIGSLLWYFFKVFKGRLIP